MHASRIHVRIPGPRYSPTRGDTITTVATAQVLWARRWLDESTHARLLQHNGTKQRRALLTARGHTNSLHGHPRPKEIHNTTASREAQPARQTDNPTRARRHQWRLLVHRVPHISADKENASTASAARRAQRLAAVTLGKVPRQQHAYNKRQWGPTVKAGVEPRTEARPVATQSKEHCAATVGSLRQPRAHPAHATAPDGGPVAGQAPREALPRGKASWDKY